MLNQRLLEELEEFIRLHQELIVLESAKYMDYEESIVFSSIPSVELEEFVKKNRQPTLREVLFEMIDKKGTNDVEVYKKAGMDRKHFSKIRSNPQYRPRKETIVALAFALELDKKDIETLLNSAGYTLSESDTCDLVIQFCIEKGIYDLDDVNQALNYFSLKPLIGL